MSEHGKTNLTKMEVDELKVAGVDVTAAMAELAALNGLTVTVAELNTLIGRPMLCTLAAAAGASNVSDVTITVKNAAGGAITRPTLVHVWLAGDADGLGVTSHAADTFAVKANSGTTFGATNAAGTGLLAQTKADGTLVISVTDTHKTAQFIAAQPVGAQIISVGTIVVTADYGA